jgi:hypothetical protein
MLASSIKEDLHYSGFVTDLITGYHETPVSSILMISGMGLEAIC